MKYYATVDGQTLEIDIEGEGEDLSIIIDGEKLTASVSQVTSPSLYSVILANHSHELLVEERDGAYMIGIAGQLIPVKVQSERARRLGALAPARGSLKSELAVRAPMPGLVASVAVSPGTMVTEGSELLVLEAMKMLNEVRAPRSGLVKKVEVSQGDTVESGQVLVRLANLPDVGRPGLYV